MRRDLASQTVLALHERQSGECRAVGDRRTGAMESCIPAPIAQIYDGDVFGRQMASFRILVREGENGVLDSSNRDGSFLHRKFLTLNCNSRMFRSDIGGTEACRTSAQCADLADSISQTECAAASRRCACTRTAELPAEAMS